MTGHTLYISPEYNPHSLERDWGFFMRAQYPEIYAGLARSLDDMRLILFARIANILASTGKAENLQANTGQVAPKVTTDAIAKSSVCVYDEVGLDTLSLALLADVPIHRPLHLSHNSLVGQWRWLRQVWRHCVPLTYPSRPDTGLEKFEPHPEIVEAIRQGRNNAAIALLRQSFQKLDSGQSDKTGIRYQTFLANLTLFCPFIGTELLWRQGLITAVKDRRLD